MHVPNLDITYKFMSTKEAKFYGINNSRLSILDRVNIGIIFEGERTDSFRDLCS